MKDRILNVFLALVLALALLPVDALAAERPATLPYKSLLRTVQSNSGDAADGLIVDVDGDSTPELLLAYEYEDSTQGASFYTIENNQPKFLVNACSLTGDLTFYSNDYVSINLVTRDGKTEIMAMKMSYFAAETDPQYGQLYRDQAEYWFYRFSGGKLTQTDHWAFNLLELEDGRYFESEGAVWHNSQSASVEALSRAMERVTVQQTVSLFDDTDGYPLDQLILAADGKFSDVPAGEYYAAPVDWAVGENITKGTSCVAFSPNNPCTRGQIVTFLWRAAGCPEPQRSDNPYRDVKPDDYFCKAVLWAVEKGVTIGTGPTTFSPGLPCTRCQVVTFLHRYADEPQVSAKNPFRDVEQGAYYYDAVLWAVKNQITQGTGSAAFSPNQTCTRAQIVTFLYRALADQSQPPVPQTWDLFLRMDAETNTPEYGRELAWHVSHDTDMDIVAVEGIDSRSNLEALAAGETQFCLCRSDTAYHACNGTGSYARTGALRGISAVTALYMDPVRVFTCDDSLQMIDDLKGKTVAIGEKGSDIYRNALDILGVYGMTESDIRPVYRSFDDAVADDLETGGLDAAFVLSSRPVLLQCVDERRHFHIVRMDDKHIDALLDTAPYYLKKTSDVEIYGMTDVSGTVCVSTLLMARNDVPDADVAHFLAAIHGEQILFSEDASMAQLFLPDLADSIRGIPLHPGAASVSTS